MDSFLLAAQMSEKFLVVPRDLYLWPINLPANMSGMFCRGCVDENGQQVAKPE
jgi:hypothetical protein